MARATYSDNNTNLQIHDFVHAPANVNIYPRPSLHPCVGGLCHHAIPGARFRASRSIDNNHLTSSCQTSFYVESRKARSS